MLVSLFLNVLMLSCSNEKKETNSSVLTKNKTVEIKSKKAFLSEINTLLPIPSNYIKTNLKNYYSIPDSLKGNLEYETLTTEAIERMENVAFTSKIFIDSLNKENSIWVVYGKFLPYLPLNKETAIQAVAMIKSQVNNQLYPSTFTEQKLAKRKGFTYIKMKAIEEHETYQKYMTFYLISSKKRSFMIKIFNKKDVDFQSLINKIVFREEN